MVNHIAIEAMKSRVRSILVAELKEVCRGESLAVSGAKLALQSRIIARIDQMVSTNNISGLESMRSSLTITGNRGAIPSIRSAAAQQTSSQRPVGTSGTYTNGTGLTRPNGIPMGTQFRSSPFYESLEPLARPTEMPPYPNHRNQATITFTLSPQNMERMRNDSSMRILLYCAAKNDTATGIPADVSFPQQLEVKVNEQEVKANFKGLKNKPGSTRPADITGFVVTKQPHFTNRVLITYALTQKGFVMVAMLVKKRSVDELVTRIQRGKIISREKVLGEMQARASDPDIVVGDSVMTLKDPVSYTRIGVPCRSDICSHHQCFDAATFLQLQEQAPTWTCPICNKVVSFEGLVVDKYFEDILQRTSTSTYQVTVKPNGHWSTSGTDKTSAGQNGAHYDDSEDENSDDDLIEIMQPSIKRESLGGSASLGTPFSFAVPTPPRASPAIQPGSGARQGQKRKSEIIDLTLSDDDEPAPKRPAYSTPNSLPDPSRPGRTNGYQSYPSNPPSFSNRANPLRFQLGSSNSGSSGGNSSSTTHSNINNDYSSASNSRYEDDEMASLFGNGGSTSYAPSRSSHRPSPLSGSALAPIDLDDSPPHRPPSALAPYSANSSTFGGQGTTLPRFDFDSFPSPPPIPASAQHTRNANSHNRPEQNASQRNALRALANPFGRYDPE